MRWPGLGTGGCELPPARCELFHKKIPVSYISQVFDTMEQTPRHIFQVLTKRSSLLRRFVNERYSADHAPAHIWLGVSIEDKAALVRLRHLQETRASVRF